jgi:acetaldehyde dehydrogenase (acetylating)
VAFSVDKVEARGMGTTELPEVTIRVSTFSQSDTGAEAQAIVAKVEDLLKDATLTISGYRMAGKVVWRESVPLGATEINGVKVNEWVSQFTAWIEV